MASLKWIVNASRLNVEQNPETEGELQSGLQYYLYAVLINKIVQTIGQR